MITGYQKKWQVTLRTSLLSSLLAVSGATMAGIEGQTAMDDGEKRKVWKFQVMLDDRDIGEHQFTIIEDGAKEKAVIEADFKVKIAFITAYQYSHVNVENWQSGCLTSISSSTNDNGERFLIEGQADNQGFDLRRNDDTESISKDCLQTFAYWRPSDILKADSLLNSQTGQLQQVKVRLEDSDQVEYNGQSIKSDRYVIETEEGEIRLWYAADSGRWLALESPTESGRVIRYQPLQVPDLNLEAPDQTVELAQR